MGGRRCALRYLDARNIEASPEAFIATSMAMNIAPPALPSK